MAVETADAVAKLKVELEALNLQCHLARDHEIRYALQRTRLEGARMQLLVKIVEAAALPPPGAVCSSPPALVADAARRTPAQPVEHRRPSAKPANLPTLTDMVLAVLDGEQDGMRARDIAEIARQTWGPGIRPHGIATAAWKLANRGQLEKSGHCYKLNGHAR